MKVTLSINGDALGKRELTFRRAGEYTIGRVDDAPIRVDDLRVSKRHALLIIGTGEAKVRDLNSANGTSVDGVPLGGGAPACASPRGRQIGGDVVLEPTVVQEDARPEAAKSSEARLRDGSTIDLGSTVIRVGLDLDEAPVNRTSDLIGEAKAKMDEAISILEEAVRIDPFDRRAKVLIEAVEKLKIRLES